MAKTCNSCKDNDLAVVSMSAASYEANEQRHERREKRLVIALIVAIVMLFACNCAWLCAWCQYDYSSEEIIVEQDAQDGGNANYIGNNGDINNGVSENNNS